MMLDVNDLAAVKLLADAADAERCWHIYRSPIAVQRPVAAWSALPLGLGVTETLTMIAEYTAEDVPAELHQEYLAALHIRRERAKAAWHSHLATKEGRTHVH